LGVLKRRFRGIMVNFEVVTGVNFQA